MAQLISLNMERSEHLDRIIPFLCARSPDVVCLQELMADDIARISDATGLRHVHYVQMAVHPLGQSPFGIGILSRAPFAEVDDVAIAGINDVGAVLDRSTAEARLGTCRYALARARVTIDRMDLRIATTHFPWTPDGEAREFQAEAVDRLIKILQRDAVVLTGDFNAPRGGPIFAELARELSDCIPAYVVTSIDPRLHRAGPLPLMVDGLFASRHYSINDVQLHCGLSDHQAISARVEPA